MNSTETSRLRVEIEGDEGEKTLLMLQGEAKELNKELRRMKDAGEEGSDAWKELKLRQKEVSEEVRDMTRNIDLQDASMSELRANARLMNRELDGLKVGSEEWIAKMKEVADVEDRIKEVRDEMKKLKGDTDEQTSGWDAFKIGFMGAFTFEAVKEAAEAIYDFGKDVLEITAKFEKYNAILETTLGSTQAGAAAFEMIQGFAAKTNFTVDELTESYIKLANRGLRPGQDELMKLADVSNATGHTFGELTEAINDINNTDRWNEIGIKCETTGDKVKLTFKGMTQEVDRTEEGVMKAVEAFGEMPGVMGMTEKISATLEGQLSNLDDNFDRLKTTIGGDAKGAFVDIIAVANQMINAFIDVWKGTGNVREAFGEVFTMAGRLGESIGSLIRTLFNMDDKTKGTAIVTDMISVAFKLVGTVLMVAIGAVGFMVDALNALQNKGKEVANFFGAGFKINPTANFDTLTKNMGDNAKAISGLWTASEGSREATSKKTDAAIVDNNKKSGQTISAEAKKEAEKRAKEHEKAEADSLKKIEDMKVKAIADETARKVAEINLQYDREDAAVKKSVASQTTKNTQLALLATEREAKIEKVEEDARVKKEKAETDAQQKIDALKIKLIADDSQRRIAEMNAQAARDSATINKTIIDETQKAEALKLVNDKLSRDVQAENDKQREAEAKKNTKLRADEATATKQLFDNEFKEAVALSDAKLINAKDNADAIYNAKLERLKAEYEYNKRKLQMEADEEKRKNEDLIKDSDRRAEADKAIDAKLKATLAASDAKFETDKTKLHDENLQKRKADVNNFFSAVQSAMDGDYTGFMKLLTDKLTNSKAANAKDKADFKLTTDDKFALAGLAVTGLIALNKKYLDDSLAKITKEKETQLASWKSQYDTGKISKDDYEKQVAKINEEAAAKEKDAKLAAWKRDQALQIAMAVINTAQAAVKSLAMMGWPFGLIGAAAAVISGGIQIAMIKSQKPPSFAAGGYVKNAGVVQGDRHGNEYGKAGISMVNRRTGQEVGEMEGDEPFMILSRNTYKNNKKTVDMLLHSSLHRNGAAIGSDGGSTGDYVGNRPAFSKGGRGRMFDDGGFVLDTSGAGFDSGSGGGGGFDDGSRDPSVSSAANYTADTSEKINRSQEMMETIGKNTEATVAELKTVNASLAAMSGKMDTEIGLMGRVADKNLSVSVQTVVNVWNQINVVNGASNMR